MLITKQIIFILGASYWVFPGATHNRFEHGIGTSYLCGLMLSTLRDHHKKETHFDNVISDKDILCVKIAGLCHDIGHGPFSHFFEGYIKRINPEAIWRHEYASCSMFDYLLQSNADVSEMLRKSGIDKEEIDLIKRMIKGRDPKKDNISETTEYCGERLKKWFLYEVVSNKRTGIDCDKFDYFARDAHHVGVTNSFDFLRFFKNIRILGVNGQLQICVRDKEVFNLYEIFHVRWMLHHQVYQHKTIKIIDDMIYQALAKVDTKFGISTSITDMKNYMWMTDSLIYEILRSRDSDPNIKEAQSILNRLQKRLFYKFCGQVISCEAVNNETKRVNLNVEDISHGIASMAESLNIEDIHVNITYIGIGMEGKNPLNDVIFYSKSGNALQLRSNNLSKILPNTFEEEYIRVYCKCHDKNTLVEEAFTRWCEENDYNTPTMFDPVKEQCFSTGTLDGSNM